MDLGSEHHCTIHFGQKQLFQINNVLEIFCRTQSVSV